MGIKKGDRLFIHSYCASLGKIADIRDVIDAFLEAIDFEGIIAMPAYSYYTWPKERYFNPQTTKAETGVLPNAFIHFSNVYRTIQGNHSVAVWGDKDRCIIRDWVPSSFSHDSTIYKTVEECFKNVMIGTSFSTGCSIFHCIEEELRVSYRFWKSFSGIVQAGKEKREFDFPMFVRNLAYTVDLRRAEPFLEKTPFVKSCHYNYGKLVVFPLKDAYDKVKSELEKNPMLFISSVKKT
ncbi:MAG: AAC(3) family N-acetyltransferase [Candidatus Omnitrophica bacterium]|nr:AAC(3) family N-acetyltransferase [Candidatus Omnitrophota bacterium]